MTDEFSFRWGVPFLDAGFTQIPNLFFDHYSEVGASKNEFLLILHLARYKYEAPGSECRPSISTVAKQMGCTDRAVSKWIHSLKTHGMLTVTERPGYPSLYSFEGFSEACLRAGCVTDDAGDA